MILVLDKDKSLYLFSSPSEAEAQLEAIDIENGDYCFCDDTGQKFVAEITSPVAAFRSGHFRLAPEGASDAELLTSFLARARSLERAYGELRTLDDLRLSLAKAKS
jgi:hypothetical protein